MKKPTMDERLLSIQPGQSQLFQLRRLAYIRNRVSLLAKDGYLYEVRTAAGKVKVWRLE